MTGHARTKAARGILVLLLILSAMPAGPAAQGNLGDPSALEAGKFLIAARSLSDPNFAQTVVLLVQYGPGGALGLIVNRPIPMRLGEIVPDLEGPGADDELYVGGPVARGSLAMLIASDDELAEAQEVVPGVHFSRSRALMERLAENKKARFRVFVGYAGWSPGQLDNEVDRGGWYVVRADEAAVFHDKPRDLWRLLLPADPKRSASLLSR